MKKFNIGKTRANKLIHFKNTIEVSDALKSKKIYEHRQIEANSLSDAFKKYNQ